jgi:hypothetical protein
MKFPDNALDTVQRWLILKDGEDAFAIGFFGDGPGGRRQR